MAREIYFGLLPVTELPEEVKTEIQRALVDQPQYMESAQARALVTLNARKSQELQRLLADSIRPNGTLIQLAPPVRS
jgi:hypothetical protein